MTVVFKRRLRTSGFSADRYDVLKSDATKLVKQGASKGSVSLGTIEYNRGTKQWDLLVSGLLHESFRLLADAKDYCRRTWK